VFLSTYEKPLDAKRRLQVPADYREAAKGVTGADEGLYAFAALDLDCVELGGALLFSRYQGLIENLDFGSKERRLLEHAIYSGMMRLGFDSGGRITVPDDMCRRFGFESNIVLVGLGDRFQIWRPEAYSVHHQEAMKQARVIFNSQGAR
jgi:MraZ protein